MEVANAFCHENGRMRSVTRHFRPWFASSNARDCTAGQVLRAALSGVEQACDC